MSNEIHNDTHHENPGQTERAKSKTAFQSSFWFVIILVFLFIAAINFANVMGKSGEGEKSEASKEAGTPATEMQKTEERTDTANVKHGHDADTIQSEQHL
ncbi:MAG: hypothetical protein P4L41_13365 [Flavipsychrobacter sp.]|jgi:hypothetical protein|nr:hypothetical protein [Flavipsychrobacter sp.]